jgi:hypothetical protein
MISNLGLLQNGYKMEMFIFLRETTLQIFKVFGRKNKKSYEGRCFQIQRQRSFE